MDDFNGTLNGSGVYRKDDIEEHFDPTITKTFVPHIEEIRAIRGEDDETYINIKDMTIAMKQVAMSMSTPTLSTLAFIRRFSIELITARRA